jgi:hypothetical protein
MSKKNYGAYYYDPETELEMICKIPIITKQEQIDYIQKAITCSKKDDNITKLHKSSYDYYERDGELIYGLRTTFKEKKPPGYCKTYNIQHGKRYSLSPFTSHSCLDCLAKFLIITRETSPGVEVEINIVRPKSDLAIAFDISKLDNLNIKINKGRCFVSYGLNETIPFVVKDFKLIIRPNQKPLIVLEHCYDIQTNQQLYGNAVATMIGIPICTNILNGKECIGMHSEPTDEFEVNAIPKGYPAFTEIKEQNASIGKIWIHYKCKPCATHESRQKSIFKEIIEGKSSDVNSLLIENKKLRQQLTDMYLRIKELEGIVKH